MTNATPTPRKRRLRTQKTKECALWESYGLKKPPKPRYVGLQGILWFLMSQNIRREEFAKYGGRCVDGCGRAVSDWKSADCGHFQTAARASTRFLRENLALQTRYCNTMQRYGDANHYLFGKEIDARYGDGTAERIVESSRCSSVVSKEFLLEKIDEELKKWRSYQ